MIASLEVVNTRPCDLVQVDDGGESVDTFKAHSTILCSTRLHRIERNI